MMDHREKRLRERNKRMRKRTRRRRRLQIYSRMGFLVLVLCFVFLIGKELVPKLRAMVFRENYIEQTGEEIDLLRPDIDVQLLTINEYSRPGTATKRINGIVIHYTANPGSTALQNRNYFEGLKDRRDTQASSHFIVGLEGEIIQCVPTKEVAYASNNRNSDTISIETCHEKSDGIYNKATYDSMVELTAWLCKKFDLTEEDVIRHYDVTGKNCPKYFVEYEDAWDAFKEDVGETLEQFEE